MKENRPVAIRWDVERALMWSNIRPLARFVVLALATKSDADSGIIPAEFTPSLSTLHEMTGLAKSQVVKELDYAEALGWVKRARPTKPSRNGRTSYAIAVGTDDPDRPTGPHHGQVEPVRTTDSRRPADEHGPVRTADETSTADESTGPHHGRDETEAQSTASEETAGRKKSAPRTGPPHGHASTKSKPKTKRTTEASPSSSTSGEVEDPNAGLILKGWIDYCTAREIKLPPRLIGHYAKEIKTALDAKFSANHIKTALGEMFTQKATSSPSQLPRFLVEVQTGPREWPNRGAPAAYQNPTDDDDYDDWTKNAPPTKR